MLFSENQIKVLDSDEAQFLSEIDRIKSERERKARLEEKKEIEEVKISFFIIIIFKKIYLKILDNFS